jgi:protoheme IX farnesyltransferase
MTEATLPLARSSALTDLVAVTKPRIISLLVFVAAASAVAAAHGLPPFRPFVAVCIGGALAAGGANALNCAYDRDLDGRMRRTRRRPLPSGRLSTATVLALGVGLTLLAFGLLCAWANLLAACLGLAGGVWYVAVYTVWLKRRSVENIVIGGAAGAFPAVVGWAAVTGHVGLAAVELAAVILLWTPPHFWALATILEADYRSVGIPMLPVVAGRAVAARRMLVYAVATVAVSVAPPLWTELGPGYVVAALVLGSWLVAVCVRHRRLLTAASAGRVFRASMLYLAAVFLAAAVGGAVH